jgi:exopolysaccharide biosynthesis polyprenyl glycosylphosphotransferase
LPVTDTQQQSAEPVGSEPDGRAEEPTSARPGDSSRRAQRLLSGAQITRTRVVLDTVLLAAAALAAVAGARDAGVAYDAEYLTWLFIPLSIVVLATRGMYSPTRRMSVLDGAAHILGATALAAMVLLAVQALADPASQAAPLLTRVWVFGTLFVGGGRLALAAAERNARRNRVIARRTLIVGAGRIGAQVERRLLTQPELGLLPIGYVDFVPAPDELAPGRTLPFLGHPEDMPRIALDTGAEHVILAFASARGSDRMMLPYVRQFEQLGLTISVVPRLFEMVNMRVEVEHLGGMPLLGLRSVNPKGWQFAVKHAADRAASALLLALLSPLLTAVALAVRLSSPGPILYRQARMGRDGRQFDLLKFRSMRVDAVHLAAVQAPVADLSGTTGDWDLVGPGGVEGVDRRTSIGRFLRRSSLDELPQLWNVLTGEMSLVGPRPERPEFVVEFGGRLERYKDRHRVKSGITGWAQVHGLRGQTSLADRIEWDNYYIENWSLWLDFKILLMTVVAVFRGGAE